MLIVMNIFSVLKASYHTKNIYYQLVSSKGFVIAVKT